MNYRHEFHAGNFADVFKHVVLTRILTYLQRKAAPYRFIDTHAGSGRYRLDAGAAARTGEWRDGIGRLDPDAPSFAAMGAAARDLLAPYLALAGDARRGAAPYPGSPAIAQAMARPFDRMMLCELHPAALAALTTTIGKDKRAKIVALDGYIGLNAFIPPVERRGLILIDPPFEDSDEFAAMTEAILAAHAKWREGILMAWFPIKDRRPVATMLAAMRATLDDALLLELHVDAARTDGPLAGSGLLVVNPPFVLASEMRVLLPALARHLAPAGSGSWSVGALGG